MRKLRLGWDYFSSGLWELDADDGGWVSIEPEDPPISDQLRLSGRRWADEQTLAYNGTEPVSDEARDAWRQRALALGDRLKEELSGDVDVEL